MTTKFAFLNDQFEALEKQNAEQANKKDEKTVSVIMGVYSTVLTV